MQLKSVLFGASLAGALAAASMAGAATIVTQTTPGGVAAATGLTGPTLDFENYALGPHSQIRAHGVTITSDNEEVVIDRYSGQFNTFGQSLSDGGWGFNELYFTFDQAVDGFGFFFGASDFAWELTAYDDEGKVLETLLIPAVGDSNAGDFFGIKSARIARASLRNTGAPNEYVLLDNFTLGGVSAVPEPATWAMMIAGFGMAGAAVRRRRTALAAAA